MSKPIFLFIALLLCLRISHAQAPDDLLPHFFAAEEVAKAGLVEANIYQYESPDSLPISVKRIYLAKDRIEQILFDKQGHKVEHSYFAAGSGDLSHKNVYLRGPKGLSGIHYTHYSREKADFQRQTLFDYDAAGQKTNQKIYFLSDSAQVLDSETWFSYNEAGQLQEESTRFLAYGTQGPSQRIEYDRTEPGRIDKISWLGEEKIGIERYSFKDGRLQEFSVPDQGSLCYAYHYNSQGQLVREEWTPKSQDSGPLPEILAIEYVYNADGFLQRVSKHSRQGKWKHKIFQYRYE